jgi:ankyrin repeat protein
MDSQYGVPALYAVTGVHNVPRIARMLLEAGANPTDGESVFHAAEKYHVEALELLLEYGVELNETGEWGNSPLHFLLNWWDIETNERVEQGLTWLLDHGADANVRSGRERETALHAAARRGQPERVVRLLLERGADVNATRADGKTAWLLARRGGFDGIAGILEDAGAVTEPLTPVDELLAACGRGDSAAARRHSSAPVLASLDEEATRLLTDSAARNGTSVVLACLAGGFPVDTKDSMGATALHHAAIHGNALLVRALLEHGADWRVRDGEHASSPLGWACFGADMVTEPDGDYVDTVRALIQAGARPVSDEHWPQHDGVAALLRSIPS